jgi:hypothetical protein
MINENLTKIPTLIHTPHQNGHSISNNKKMSTHTPTNPKISLEANSISVPCLNLSLSLSSHSIRAAQHPAFD